MKKNLWRVWQEKKLQKKAPHCDAFLINQLADSVLINQSNFMPVL